MAINEKAKRLRVLRRIVSIAPTLPGSIQAAYTKCGKAGCRCTKGHLHGPSHRLIYRRRGKATSVYVPPALVSYVQKALQNRKRLEKLVEDLVQIDLLLLLRRR